MKKLLTLLLAAPIYALAQVSYTGIVEDVQPIPQGQRSQNVCGTEIINHQSVFTCKTVEDGEVFLIVVSVRNTLYRFRTIHHYHKGDKVRVEITARLEDE